MPAGPDAAGDIGDTITTAAASLGPTIGVVAAAALTIGFLQYGFRRAWSFFKGMAH